MKAMFSWGYEAPVRQDYTKNDADITNKIRKTRREYISENHDNFRKPEKGEDKDSLLFNYFESDEIEMLKKRIFEMHQTKEREQRNKSSYKEQFCQQTAAANEPRADGKKATKRTQHEVLSQGIYKELINEVSNWTAAGKPQYGKKPAELRQA